jgi:hypothetical protein
MDNVMKKYKELRKLLENKRYRAMIILAMYLVFMALVIVAIKTKQEPVLVLNDAIESFKLENKYNYSYTIISKQEEQEILLINGKRYLDKEQIIFNEKVYNFKTGSLIGFPLSTIDVNKLNYDSIYEYLYSSTLISKDSISERYELPLSSLIKKVNNITVSSDKNIPIMVVYMNDKITQIDLDLTNYVNFNEETYDSYIVSIIYNNVGNVVDF